MRQATLVGGVATGALLLAGSAAQAAETQTEADELDAVQSSPDALGLPVPTDVVQALDAVQGLPAAGIEDTAGDAADQDPVADVAGDNNDLLGDLGGGLPLPLPF